MRVGLIGWRGMVGSVLLRRMQEERDFDLMEACFFSTSQAGTKYIANDGKEYLVANASDLLELSKMDVLVSCQGGEYTKSILPALRSRGWNGYWIDAASTKRMDSDSIIILDPINRKSIERGLQDGVKNFIGGNCSITLSLIGLGGVFKEGLIDWMSMMTYQAASGAGAANIRELLLQNQTLVSGVSDELKNKNGPILPILEKVGNTYLADGFPKSEFGAPLAGSLIPWIDSDLGNGSSREEWKGEVEANKILGHAPGTVKVDGLCVRVPVIRSHSAAITMSLKREIPIAELESIISKGSEWVTYVPNNKEESVNKLSPAYASGTLKISVGRLKKLNLPGNIYSVMTCGDQLLWGAAEPLRRMLRILLDGSVAN